MIKYLAGIFDAEGYVRIRRTKSGKGYSYTYEARIYMCNLDIVTLFSKQYNLKISSSNRGLNRKTAYYVALNGKLLRETSFINDLLPYLNEKRIQLQEVKNLIDGNKNKEDCYQDYMKAKENFTHPIIGILDYEYLAGVIDGDGWFSLFNAGKGKQSLYNNYSFGIEQRYKPMIEYFSQFNKSAICKTKTSDSVNHVQTYSWYSSTADILFLLEKIEPFLVEKKEKCNIIIEYIKKQEEFRMYAKNILYSWKNNN